MLRNDYEAIYFITRLQWETLNLWTGQLYCHIQCLLQQTFIHIIEFSFILLFDVSIVKHVGDRASTGFAKFSNEILNTGLKDINRNEIDSIIIHFQLCRSSRETNNSTPFLPRLLDENTHHSRTGNPIGTPHTGNTRRCRSHSWSTINQFPSCEKPHSLSFRSVRCSNAFYSDIMWYSIAAWLTLSFHLVILERTRTVSARVTLRCLVWSGSMFIETTDHCRIR